MKKLFVLFLLPFIFSSCLEEGTNHVKYTGWIIIDEFSLPDTALVGQYINIPVKGGAPNGCWSDLELQLTKESDSTVYITGTGTFESTNGICNDIYQNTDTVFEFKPVKTGVLKFTAFSAGGSEEVDSLIVISGR